MSQKNGVYRRLVGYLKQYPLQVVLAYTATIMVTVLKLFVPQIIKIAIDYGLDLGNARALFLAGGVILLIAVFLGVGSFAMMYYGLWLTDRIAYDLRNDFYNAVQYLPFAFHDKAQTGDLMSRATSDIGETERFVGVGLRDLVATVLLMVGVTAAMLWEDWQLALLALIPLPILVFTALRFGNTIRPMFKSIQEQMGILSTTMQESLTGIQVVKAFAREPHELEKFDEHNDTWFDRRYKVIKTWANYWPFFTFTLAVSIFILLWFAGPQVMTGEITVGTLFVMISYILMLNGPVQRVGFLVNLASTAGASSQRVFDILDEPYTIQNPPNPIALPNIQAEVRFENVSFAYDNGPEVLHKINFVAHSGETVALMGLTGSGKSTITNLIPRFYDPLKGEITVDGLDIRTVNLTDLRHQIGIVLQDPFLFSSTIAENIAYGRPKASLDDIIASAKVARAHKFIMEFPDGYKTRVGERGVTLSGGQKQRIAIARALLCDPRILILDDSTSSVDTETEHLIQQALGDLMEGRTTFIIAQRLLTLKKADKILVIDDGRIIERGTHDELLDNNGLYREIYDLQLKDQEELAQVQSSEFGV